MTTYELTLTASKNVEPIRTITVELPSQDKSTVLRAVRAEFQDMPRQTRVWASARTGEPQQLIFTRSEVVR